MKGQCFALIKVVVLVLLGSALSGCVTMDTMSYLRNHRGEGSRVAMLGSEAELMDDLVKHIEGTGDIVTREPHVVLSIFRNNLSYGFYFYPSQLSNHTDVEVVYTDILGPDSNDPGRLENQADAFFDKFSAQYLDANLLKGGADKTLREGAANKLRWVAHIGNREMALHWIEMGADVDLAIKKHSNYAASLVQYFPHPELEKVYAKALMVAPFLTELKGEPERVAKRKEAERAEEERFQAALREYLAAAIKPQLPEEARKYKVQAEGAVNDKNFAEAALLFRQALILAPCWPVGHFNLSLVLAESQDYAAAIIEMQRYLALVPEASDARAAQDKIYGWERKAHKDAR